MTVLTSTKNLAVDKQTTSPSAISDTRESINFGLDLGIVGMMLILAITISFGISSGSSAVIIACGIAICGFAAFTVYLYVKDYLSH